MLSDAFVLAFKNLKHRGVRSWLTLVGIFIGITAVVSLISLGNGLQVAVASQFSVSQTATLTIQASGFSGGNPPGTGVIDPLTVDDLAAIERLGSIDLVVRRNIESGRIEYNDRVIFNGATNVPSGEAREYFYELLDVEVIDGRLLKDDDRRRAIVGYNFYADKVDLDRPLTVGKSFVIQDTEFEVVGVLEKKGSFILDNIVYLNEDDASEIFGYGDDVDIIVARPTDPDDLEKAKEDVERLLRKSRDVDFGDEDFEVSTPESALSGVNDIIAGVQAFIAIVASISIFIGALGIVNTMTTSVLERRRQIGIMKSIGARNSDIFIQFFVESSLLGLVGGILGAILGTIIGVIGTIGINNFVNADVSPTISFPLIFFSLLGSFIIGGLAGIVPAMNAARENPVDALRG